MGASAPPDAAQPHKRHIYNLSLQVYHNINQFHPLPIVKMSESLAPECNEVKEYAVKHS